MFQFGCWGWQLLALQRTEPVVRWQPHEGLRHAHRPREAEALCGLELVVRQAGELEWLDDTCAVCRRAAWTLVNPAIPYPGGDIDEEMPGKQAEVVVSPKSPHSCRPVAAVVAAEGK